MTDGRPTSRERYLAARKLRLSNPQAALTRYDEVRDAVDHRIDKALPANPGTAHAVAASRRAKGEPLFLDSPYLETALCGVTVKVLLPVTFDPGDPDACQACAARSFAEQSAQSPQDGRHSTSTSHDHPA